MNIAVYCSSSNHITENYLKTGYNLGKWLAENKYTLVFGGATGGLMSTVSEGANSASGEIIGIIPTAVINMNRQSPLCTQLITVDTMSERKAQMKESADIFIVLPGSYGTLDEMFDVTASAIVGEHKKPLIVLNENGFYNELMLLTEKMKAEKFIPIENYKPIYVNSLDECFALITSISAVDK